MNAAIIIIILSIVFSAFFSGVEIAFVTANKLKIELNKSRNILSGRIVSWFNKREANFIAMLLVGNNISLVIYGMNMEKIVNPLLASSLPYYLQSDFAILFANTLISTFLILILAEYIPKATFRLVANKAIELFSLPLIILYFLLFPFVWFFIKISEIILKYGFRTSITTQKHHFSTIDLDYFIQDFHREEFIENGEIESDIQLFKNAIEFRSTKIRECMVPRTEIKSVELDETIERLIEIFHQTGHSKILVHQENIDNIIGYVHAYDLLKKPETIQKILRTISMIPETMAANTMLNKMIKEHNSIALVLDEFGGTSGIITMEDLMEEIFGEIEDEFDKDQSVEKQIDENTYLFSARLEIDYLNETYHLNLVESDEFETLGGYVIHHHESIPQKGTIMNIDDNTFEIIQAGNTKIDLIKISVNKV
jgi:CBS domain containing-hemolysin-like protein